jgi:hypothetical protein
MNRISNYDDLVAARKMSETIIADRKQIIHERVESLKEKISPLLLILPILNIFKKNGAHNNSLLKVGTSLAIDLLVGQKLLGKAGWITRLLVPTLLKTVSSRVIENVKKD